MAHAQADFEKNLALLKKADPTGRTLHDHLVDVLAHVVKTQPDHPLHAFEAISAKVKQSTVAVQHFKELPGAAGDPAFKKQHLASLERTSRLCAPPPEDAKGEDPVIPDIMAQTELLEWAGVSLGREDMYKLTLSIQQLTKEKELDSVRFFGKFFGTSRDYLVVEAKMSEYPQDEEDKKEGSRKEAWGTGANAYTYFAANYVSGPWTQLPAVLPEQIIIARQMRRFLTGDLKAPVLGFPRFAWGEAAYLRTQIARISASTWVSPRGFYNHEEDSGAVTEAEDFKALPPSALTQADGWVHHRHHLLKQGRATAFVEPEKDEEESKEDKKEEEDTAVALLSSVADDQGPLPGKQLWAFRRGNDGAITTMHDAVSAHSMLWPGSVSVAKGREVVNIYVGWAQKYLPASYTPPPPPAIQSEYAPSFNPEEEKDPLAEQSDPLPPKKEDKKPGAEDGEGEAAGEDEKKAAAEDGEGDDEEPEEDD